MKKEKTKRQQANSKEYTVSVTYGNKSLEECMRRVIQIVTKRTYQN